MIQIYIACALTHVKKANFDEYSLFIRSLATEIEKTYGIKCKYALRDSDPQLNSHEEEDKARLCYLWDRQMVESSDLIIAEASFPSTGLGMEVEIANSKSIPVILIYRNYDGNSAEVKEYTLDDGENHSLQIGNRIVSLMLCGCPNIIKLIEYSGIQDGIYKTLQEVNRLIENKDSTIA